MSIKKRWQTRFEKCAIGWKRNSVDIRDFKYQARDIHLPTKASLYHLLPNPWLYQGNLGSCVAHGIANQLYGIERKGPISRLYLFYYARYLEAMRAPTTDGAYPRLAYKALQKVSCPYENIWPYKASLKKANIKPSIEARQFAYKRLNMQYKWLQHNPDTVRKALVDGHLVTIGIQVTPQMLNYNSEILKPDNDIRGGHYMCIFGYEKNHFLIANSWYGREIFLFDESMIEWRYTDDMAVVTME